MPRPPIELKKYANQELMDDLNQFFVTIKVHLLPNVPESVIQSYPKPTVKEMDEIMLRLMDVLKKDSSPMRKY